jgi:hypothetical protein
MDGDPLEYSPHAREKMISDGFNEDDVEGTIDWPVRRERSYHGRIKHFGYASDGRRLNVVTDSTERFVITIIDLDKRRRKRRRSK